MRDKNDDTLSKLGKTAHKTKKGQAKNKKSSEKREDSGRITWGANIQLGIVLICIVAAFILSQTIGSGEREVSKSTEKRPLLVRTVDVSALTQSLEFTRTGETEVNNQIRIVPQVSGRITSVHPDFDDGGTFEADTQLFQIEQNDYINQRNIARAEVERAQTQLALEQAEAQAAREEWDSLNPGQAIPPLVARTPQLKQAQANLKAARAQLDEAELDLSRTNYTLPYAGRVVETDIEVGQYVQAGQSYGTLYSKSAIQVRVPMEDRLLQYIDKDETRAQIKTNYRGEDIVLRGEIERLGGQLNENTRFVDVIITPLGENWDKILPNVFVDVTLSGMKINNLWRLPNSVLQGADSVWIVDEDKSLHLYRPQILSIGDEYTLAIGNGETVKLVDGLLKGGSDGMTVRLVEDLEQETTNKQDDTHRGQRIIDPAPQRTNDNSAEDE